MPEAPGEILGMELEPRDFHSRPQASHWHDRLDSEDDFLKNGMHPLQVINLNSP